MFLQRSDVKARRKIRCRGYFFFFYPILSAPYKLGRCDGCVRYCDIGGRTYSPFDKLGQLQTKVMKLRYRISEKHGVLNLIPISSSYESHIFRYIPEGENANTERLPAEIINFPENNVYKRLPRCR